MAFGEHPKPKSLTTDLSPLWLRIRYIFCVVAFMESHDPRLGVVFRDLAAVDRE